MAIVTSTRELEPRGGPPTGWEGKRLDEMLATSDVEVAPPGYPITHDFLSDIEGFYRGWLGREVP